MISKKDKLKKISKQVRDEVVNYLIEKINNTSITTLRKIKISINDILKKDGYIINEDKI